MALGTIFSLFSRKKKLSEESVLSDNKNKQEVKINEPV